MLMSIRVRYEDGVLIPLEPLEGIENGQEFTVSMAEEEDGAVFVTLPKPEMTPELMKVLEEAKATQGMFADLPDLEEAPQRIIADDEEGGAVYVTLPKPEMTPELMKALEEAKATQGMFADLPEFDQAIEDLKKDWDEWHRRLLS